MTLQRIAAVCVWLAIDCAAAAAQRHESRHLVRDLNGGWETLETRTWETRDIGPSEQVEEEWIRRPDLSGNLALSERRVTRRSAGDGRDDEVIETYAQNAEGFVRSDSRLALSSRVRISTTSTADGGRKTVEEVEARNPVSPGDPRRLLRRTVVTVRMIGPDRWATERLVFERDLNGRLAPVVSETEDTVER